MNFKRRSSGKEYSNNCNSDDTSHKNSSCSDDSQPTTSISQCLRYARQVSDLFSDGLKAEKKKWKRHAITDELGATEKLTWKHAKRVAKMVAIQNKNLDHLVELIVDNVSKECPNHDVEELKDIAKSKQDSSHDSLSYKGIYGILKLQGGTKFICRSMGSYFYINIINFLFKMQPAKKALT